MISITPIPVLQDNYIWVLAKEKQALIIDPSEAEQVKTFLTKNQLTPIAILLTHNHSDHTAGVMSLREHYPQLKVFGPEEVKAFTTEIVYPQQQFSLLDMPISVIKSDGHTCGHISYLIDHHYLFCGDALFSGGCGRVLNGDYQAQFETLQYFKQLDDHIQIFPAHEYTQNNLAFAATIMPTDCMVLEYQERTDILRANKRPTLPSTIGIEKKINPFLQTETVEEFTQLRKRKDEF